MGDLSSASQSSGSSSIIVALVLQSLSMLFAFTLTDRPGAAALRAQLRPAHKAYLAQVAQRVALAGPLLQDDGSTMAGSLLVIDFESREAAERWLADEPFTRGGVYASSQVRAFANLWPQQAGHAPSVRHIVMWNVRGDTPAEREGNLQRLRTGFESLRGKVPGLLRLEIGQDTSRVDYACDVVLMTEFESQAALDAYATHPEHLRLRQELGDMRIARHQVDYAVSAAPDRAG